MIDKGGKVQVYDPKADYNELTEDVKFSIKKSIAEVAEGVDFILILTDWPEFKTFEWKTIGKLMKNQIIFDTKNFLNKDAIIQSGFRYFSIGR